MIRFSPNPNRAHLIHWLEWGEQAFQEARKQDKPLMLFLGAFWCGLCQRMDENAFSNNENIALLNGCFVPLRVENAQRPDVDVRYSQNGWPTIAFLTPQGEHLASVNYLSAEEFGIALARMYTLCRDRREELKDAVARAYRGVSQKAAQKGVNQEVRAEAVMEISQQVMELADRVHGGYGEDIKFPYPKVNEFVLDRFEATGDSRYLDHVLFTLDKMRGEGFEMRSKVDFSAPHRNRTGASLTARNCFPTRPAF